MGVKIGALDLKYGLALAPMAGYTDRAMRRICHEMGAEYSVTEMVSAKAVVYKDKKTHALAAIGEGEGAVALQIFGSEPSVMAEAASILAPGEDGMASPVMIDINMGCPVNKIFSNAEGSALMKNPDLIYKIVRAVSTAISIPTSVKIRKGIDDGTVNAVECALAAEEGGASLITVHGRTRKQMYSGDVDAEIIRKVKKSVHIPVFANGDVTTVQAAERMLKYTEADGIMIGRGAVGNPFLFSEIRAYMDGVPYEPPTVDKRVDTALLQLRYAIEDKGEEAAVLESRKQIAGYLFGFRGAATLRGKINSARTYLEVERAMREAEEENLQCQ